MLLVLAFPVTQLKTSMPSIKVVPQSDSSRVGYDRVQAAMGAGATGPLQIVTPAAQAARRRAPRGGRPRHRRSAAGAARAPAGSRS